MLIALRIMLIHARTAYNVHTCTAYNVESTEYNIEITAYNIESTAYVYKGKKPTV